MKPARPTSWHGKTAEEIMADVKELTTKAFPQVQQAVSPSMTSRVWHCCNSVGTPLCGTYWPRQTLASVFVESKDAHQVGKSYRCQKPACRKAYSHADQKASSGSDEPGEAAVRKPI
jgi:hypothetical protein